MNGILVAGIGNIFHGDDGFGVEVVQRLARRPLPPNIKVVDFGIRGMDLAYALEEDYGAVIVVDAACTGEPPGTISIIEPEPDEFGGEPDPGAVSGHNLDLASILGLMRMSGRQHSRVLLVACEPLDLGGEHGRMGLSAPVSAAVRRAIETIQQLADELAKEKIDAKPRSLEVRRS